MVMNEIIEQVLNLQDFYPSSEVNAAFSGLVESVVKHGELPDWCNEEIRREVQRRCAISEAEMEKYWAERISKSSDALMEMSKFWYMDNYNELVRREIGLLEGSGLKLGSNSRIAMIGSGPLPLTAWLLWRRTGSKVDLVDISAEAIYQSQNLATAIRWEVGEYFIADGAGVRLTPGTYDVVYVAGLAGNSLEDKQYIIDNILPALKYDGRIIVRSAAGAKSLLYPVFSPRDVQGVRLLIEYNPDDEIINSVQIYKHSG